MDRIATNSVIGTAQLKEAPTTLQSLLERIESVNRKNSENNRFLEKINGRLNYNPISDGVLKDIPQPMGLLNELERQVEILEMSTATNTSLLNVLVNIINPNILIETEGHEVRG